MELSIVLKELVFFVFKLFKFIQEVSIIVDSIKVMLGMVTVPYKILVRSHIHISIDIREVLPSARLRNSVKYYPTITSSIVGNRILVT